MTAQAPPTLAGIGAAAERLAGIAVHTPLIENPALNARAGGRVLLKAETLQRTGSFKFRGAYNFLSQVPTDARTRGVVAYSSGNHAQGVAAAAEIFDIPATIVMPADAPQAKVDNTRGFGAEVVTYDRQTESREDIAAAIAGESGATLVPPFDHAWTIEGQGTVGLEIAAQCAAMDTRPDEVLVCCGGGGLTSGIAIALADRVPSSVIKAVEPTGFDDASRSLIAGQRLSNEPGAASICDALLSPSTGDLTFAAMFAHDVTGLSVSDDEVRAAMAYAWRTLKLVLEPGGAVALAAILSGKVETKDRTIVAVLSGGNVDAALFNACIVDA
ncbi:MAG: threonine/serine dehydratase [Rhodospirillaceae bacterium]|jgi:threonine dehydratase|nr:threonine/serine dehydratase [Rhodospirillaceae bacterium]MBT5943623.1 threonine/serine dehydratase [Rhodospirillaceae bacterium]MBT6404651.1 threonine/serine dehydratase [Rhodospirillaceae bacterium]MBT7361997.1 threonine/serine dehydratase [Rhodospirillaceae bacterium]